MGSEFFTHKTVGSQMTQTEFEGADGTGHKFATQATGDLVYADSTTELKSLNIGSAGTVLHVGGSSKPAWTAAVTGVTSILNAALVIGRDADNDIDFATDNTILFRADGADQIKLTNGALLPVTDDDIDLGSSSLQFKDGYFDGTLEADAITVGGTAVLTGGAETAITSILNTSLVIGRDADNDIDFGTDNNIIFRAGAADQIKLVDGALAPVTDDDVDLGTNLLEFKDAYFDGTVTSDAFAGNLTGDVTGNADTATALATGRTIAMTGDVAWTSASFNGSGNVTGAGTIQADAVESGMLNDNIISGQTEITSGLVAADELLYSDGGTVKRVGLDTLATKMLGVASAGTVAQASDHMVFLDGGATGDVIIESIDDFLTAIAGSNVSVSSSQLTVASGSDTTYTAGTLLDLSSTTFNVDLSEASAATMAAADEFIILDNDDSSIAKRESLQDVLNTVAGTVATTGLDRSGATLVVSDLHPVGVSGSANQLLTDDGDGTVTSESGLSFTGTALSLTGNIVASGTSDHQGLIVSPAGGSLADDGLGNQKAVGVIASMRAKTGIAIGELLHIDGDGDLDEAHADATADMPAVAIALEANSSGSDANIKVLLQGFYRDDSQFSFGTVGAPVYADHSTEGDFTLTASSTDGHFIQRVGISATDDMIYFNPSLDVIERD